MKSNTVLLTAAALALCCAQSIAKADGFSLPSITISSTNVAVSATTPAQASTAVTSATTAVSSALSQASAAVSKAVSSADAAVANVATSATTAVSNATSTTTAAAPTFSLASANDYVQNFTQVCNEAIAAYKTKDIMKATSLMPKVTDMYNKGSSIASSLTGGEAKQFTDWKSSLMGAVKTAAASYLK